MRGKHERAEEHVHKVGEDYFSQCRYCGVPMRRVAKRNWIVDSITDSHQKG